MNIFIFTGTETPTQADLNTQRHLLSYVSEKVELAFASGAASSRHLSAIFLPLWGYLPSWDDFIVLDYSSSKTPFLKSPNQAQERMAIFSRFSGEHLLALCWLHKD